MNGGGAIPKADFLTLVSTLAAQGAIHLGSVAHPIHKEVRKDLRQAKYTIDLLGILEEKTRGNLTAEEKQVLGTVLSELRLRYAGATKGP